MMRKGSKPIEKGGGVTMIEKTQNEDNMNVNAMEEGLDKQEKEKSGTSDSSQDNNDEDASEEAEDDNDDIELGKDIVGDKGFTSRPTMERPRPRRQRSKSLGGATTSTGGDEASFMFSFRMPHDSNLTSGMNKKDKNQKTTLNSCMPATSSKKATPLSDYNFVLDNYVEYADNTKIPRLRGKDVDKLRAAIHSSHPIALCIAVSIACFLTYAISNHSPNLPVDISQAIVIVLVLATFPEVAASAGAGAFAGMAGNTAIPNYGWLTLLSLVVSGVWLTFHRYKILVGCGGRLGTCAFISMNITVILFGMPSGAVSWSLYGNSNNLWMERLQLVPSILSVIASTFLSATGGAIRLRSKIPLNPVQAPTTIALLFMLIFEASGVQYSEEIIAGFAVGSFVAMASDQYLATIFDFAAAGFIAGLWILLLDPFFSEFGGKKGFTSFCGFITYVFLSKVVFVKRKSSSSTDDDDDEDEDDD